MADRDPVPLSSEVRAKLAELDLELSEADGRIQIGLSGKRLVADDGRSLLLLDLNLSLSCFKPLMVPLLSYLLFPFRRQGKRTE